MGIPEGEKVEYTFSCFDTFDIKEYHDLEI